MPPSVPARYHLTPRQRESLTQDQAQIHILLPMPIGYLSWEHDLVQFARAAIADIDPYWVRSAEPHDAAVSPLDRDGDDLGAVLGEITSEAAAEDRWHVAIIGVDVALSVAPRLDDPTPEPHWPAAVELQGGERIPAAR